MMSPQHSHSTVSNIGFTYFMFYPSGWMIRATPYDDIPEVLELMREVQKITLERRSAARTPDFDSGHGGSSPSAPTKKVIPMRRDKNPCREDLFP